MHNREVSARKALNMRETEGESFMAAAAPAKLSQEPNLEPKHLLPVWVDTVFESFLAAVISAELLVMFGGILSRSLLGYDLVWGQEVGEIALMTLTYIGGIIAYRTGEHMTIQAVIERLPDSWRPAMQALEGCLVLATALGGAVLSGQILSDQWEISTSILGLSLSWVFAPFAIGMLLLATFAVERLWRLPRRLVFTVGAVLVASVAAWALALYLTGPWGGPAMVLSALGVFSLMLAIGVPIGFVLPMVSFLYLFSTKAAPLQAIPLGMQHGISGFIMLAIPFFILTGYLMTEGGLARPLADWVCALVGHVRGGLLQAVVITMYIFSGISGSKMADVATVGTTMRDMLTEQGYDPGENTAVLAAAAIMGETIPPSIAMLVMGSITTVSVGALFLAGVIPAAVIGVCLMLLIYWRARKFGWHLGRKASFSARGRATLRAIPTLLVPVVLVVGITGGIATPTEVSSFAVVYSFVLSIFIYRNIKIGALRKILAHASTASGMILLIIGAGAAFSWSLTIAHIPQGIASMVIRLGTHSTTFLLCTVITLILAGALLEGLPALLIFAPLLMPIATRLGISPLQYAIVMIFAMGLGSFMPPLGVGFYVACSIGNATVEQATRRVLPYLAVLIVGLLLVTFVPWFSLVLPQVLHISITTQ